MKGKLITFEGCEGSGKSTQISLFENYLKDNGIDYMFAREPGGTRICEKIRSIILDKDNAELFNESEALLYASSRSQLLLEKIIPALNDGKLVVLDRYIDSSYAYQGYARGLGFDFINSINTFAVNNCMPDVTIFLDINPQDAFKRKGGVDKNDRVELAGLDFHNKVYDGYLQIMKKFPDRFFAIDGKQNIEDTQKNIIELLKNKGCL